ncbi:Trypsin domain containing protein [Asbolus verrucosus]|uniref:Trypsin domain containing protein n=1 Tax=Asbolus verrucosus TaxID=1661398 RepID=A0A482VCH1_ASBVE|nr:Trypsin domain containing protein [Asbolus verrucosus]
MSGIVIILAILASSSGFFARNFANVEVIGGRPAEPGQFPFMAALRDLNKTFSCGASIIAEKWVVTAAHCVEGLSKANFTISVGTNRLSEGGSFLNVANIVSHPDYDPNNPRFNDIALVELSNEIAFDALTKPIELGPASANDPATLAGWGYTNFTSLTEPDQLQFLTTKIVSFDDCQTSWLNTLRGKQICALSRKGEGACFGDSGGPLIANEKLVGIVSFGYPCGEGYPDVYTSTSSYIDWINQYV